MQQNAGLSGAKSKVKCSKTQVSMQQNTIKLINLGLTTHTNTAEFGPDGELKSKESTHNVKIKA